MRLVAIVMCVLLAGIFGCLAHDEAGLGHAACGLQETAMLTIVLLGALLTGGRFLPSLERSGKSPAYAVSFFHPPEFPA